jgi:hypothetical protein
MGREEAVYMGRASLACPGLTAVASTRTTRSLSRVKEKIHGLQHVLKPHGLKHMQKKTRCPRWCTPDLCKDNLKLCNVFKLLLNAIHFSPFVSPIAYTGERR